MNYEVLTSSSMGLLVSRSEQAAASLIVTVEAAIGGKVMVDVDEDVEEAEEVARLAMSVHQVPRFIRSGRTGSGFHMTCAGT